ncbi:bifunctional 2-C-methyl-D-erythritol 4-phosphate cytidylyltransferase/2-C-methyl-D-erythritol 2,4-cyclodiphosphate synthase [Palleronia sp. LCG004]|uniref:bifunctional 2-C-methyl-D-erythritol 4-phosphate cytidylyltransferase/2-C-methyl-D-erythritol 2,4-cyclodiphosphate synthase n=1 Tax=Palleronia sp. LCG004 TaxID=3079304 RepID=UPI0029436612|nr:bifunctional 2-C-methyl-D-erythritol 4-phosphate cytidylyltransferase/2-C-methyl-D-erythritol 2,4-cyclodiphosphate synthase [Palleronia sp. LCG004]WOI56800.1 bifunctional 2-C-methyl-D-erythritol 4-phosphate cytidylyltransferase/2-C-methyl-D-erythritol 2,4-cyclodiphosphate synthase [Palleronia sp. LCG004]
MSDMKRTAALIVAAGRGTRAGPGLPKQWRAIGGRTVLARSLQTFRDMDEISDIVLVLHPDDMDLAAGYVAHGDVRVAAGGTSRSRSVRAGLECLASDPPDLVLIHDVARPLVTPELIRRVIDALGTDPAAAPALRVTDALWRGEDRRVSGFLDREGLFRAQTPQGFDFDAILDAHRTHDSDAADDVGVAHSAGLPVTIVEGDEDNIKITGPDDFARAETILERQMPPPPDIRLGNGYDVHAFTEGRDVMLCGVSVPHDRTLLGHSDADVGLHAITDAIYGALAAGDIGRFFPPSDPKWKGAESDIFLVHARDLAVSRGYGISNVDLTIICERPKIGPYAIAMADRVAEFLEIAADRVSVKATTSERLGFTGREEGIAAIATVTLVGR